MAIKAKTMINRFSGDGTCCLLIIVFCLAIGLPRYRMNIDLGDEGVLAYGAERVTEGQIPHRDFYCNHPPLSFYTAALAFKVFGTSLVSLRKLGLLFYIGTALLTFGISRQLVGQAASFAVATASMMAGMPFYEFVPLAIWHGVFFALFAVFSILRAGEGGCMKWSFLAGLATGATIMSRQDLGFYVSVSILVYILLLKLTGGKSVNSPRWGKAFCFWLTGTIALTLSFVIFLFSQGAISDTFEQLVVFPVTRYSETSSLPMPFFDFSKTVQHNVLIGLFYAPFVVWFAAGLCLVSRFIRDGFNAIDKKNVFIWVLTILFYCQTLSRSDVYHLLTALPPFYILCVSALTAISESAGTLINRSYKGRMDRQFISAWSSRAVLFCGIIICLWFLFYMKPIFLSAEKGPMKTLTFERGGIRVSAEEAEDAVRTIQQHCSAKQSILCLPYQPMLYFLSERHNPTRRDYFWPGDQKPEELEELILQVKSDPPAVVTIIGESEIKSYAPEIIDYVNSAYVAAYKFGRMVVYLPSVQKT